MTHNLNKRELQYLLCTYLASDKPIPTSASPGSTFSWKSHLIISYENITCHNNLLAEISLISSIASAAIRFTRTRGITIMKDVNKIIMKFWPRSSKAKKLYETVNTVKSHLQSSVSSVASGPIELQGVPKRFIQENFSTKIKHVLKYD